MYNNRKNIRMIENWTSCNLKEAKSFNLYNLTIHKKFQIQALSCVSTWVHLLFNLARLYKLHLIYIWKYLRYFPGNLTNINNNCRYRKNLRRLEEGLDEIPPCIPLAEPYPRTCRQPPTSVVTPPEMVFFCRRVYDFRQKRIVKNPS